MPTTPAPLSSLVPGAVAGGCGSANGAAENGSCRTGLREAPDGVAPTYRINTVIIRLCSREGAVTTFCFRQLRLLIHPARTVSRSGHQHQRRTSRPARVTPRHKDAAVGRPQMTLLVTAEGGLLERPRFSVPLVHRSRSLVAAVVAEPASYRSSVLALTGDILATWSTQQQRSVSLNGLASVEMLRRAMRGRDWCRPIHLCVPVHTPPAVAMRPR